jgi:hypothetical protein
MALEAVDVNVEVGKVTVLILDFSKYLSGSSKN